MKLFKKSLTTSEEKIGRMALYVSNLHAPYTSTGKLVIEALQLRNKFNLYAVLLTVPLTSFFSYVAAQPYTVDTKESIVTWKGSMAFAGKGEHVGYVSIAAGDLTVERGQLLGGRIEVDMTTIADKVHGIKNNLVEHLKDPDFFDVKKFPFSTFTIKSVTPTKDRNITVTGNLTIKGITNEVSFPATMVVNGNVFKAIGKLTIDRTKWDVRYKSGKFFSDLADEAIADDIQFDMTIVARK